MEWISLVVSVAALVVAVVALRLARRSGYTDQPRPRTEGGSVPSAVDGADPRAVRHVAVVRYDAFPDLGGQVSYSVALLDSAGDGVVLSAINGRREGRTYAKGVLDGVGETPLTPEEMHAVEAALERRGAR